MKQQPDLPPILAGASTPEMRSRVEKFFFSIPEIFEAWVARRSSTHTQRAYREDVLTFVNFLGVEWPQEAMKMLSVSVRDTRQYRDYLLESGKAPKTLNRRISSVSSFYKYLGAVAAEMRLPITIPNPAHAQFISRESSDPSGCRREKASSPIAIGRSSSCISIPAFAAQPAAVSKSPTFTRKASRRPSVFKRRATSAAVSDCILRPVRPLPITSRKRS